MISSLEASPLGRVASAVTTLLRATVLPADTVRALPVSSIAEPAVAPKDVVIATIQIGHAPGSIVVSPDNTQVYVLDSGSPASGWTVTVLDAATATVIDSIPVGNAQGLAVTADGRHLYVTGWDSVITVIDTATRAVCATIPTPTDTGYPVVSRDGTRLYVAGGGATNDTVSVIDIVPGGPTYNTIVTTVEVGEFPVGIATSSRFVYVANNFGDSVTVIDAATNTVVTTLPVGLRQPFAVAVAESADGARIYVTSTAGDSVVVFEEAPAESDGATAEQRSVRGGSTHHVRIPVGESPEGACAAPDGMRIYVANDIDDTISVIDSDPTSSSHHQVIGTIAVGRAPEQLTVSPDGARLYVSNGLDGTVSVIALMQPA